jgi:hypothetical protein
MRPTFILSDGAQPVKALENAGTRPIAAVVIAVFLRNSRLDVMIDNNYFLNIIVRKGFHNNTEWNNIQLSSK